MDALEQKEIRGLSWKALITLIICTASIVGTVLGTYNSLDRKIDDVKQQKISDDRLNEYRLRTIEVQLDATKTQVEALRQQVAENRRTMQAK